MVKELEWDLEYSEIKGGGPGVWKNFIFMCVDNLEAGGRRTDLFEIYEDLWETDFITAPASTRFHHAYEHGLLKHTCETIVLAFLMNNACDARLPYDSLLTVSLLHDYGKVGKYVPLSDSDGNVTAFKYIDRATNLSDSTLSMIYASQMIRNITEEELFAILYHDGLYPEENVRSKNRETPLLLMVHWADMWSARMDQFGW